MHAQVYSLKQVKRGWVIIANGDRITCPNKFLTASKDCKNFQVSFWNRQDKDAVSVWTITPSANGKFSLSPAYGRTECPRNTLQSNPNGQRAILAKADATNVAQQFALEEFVPAADIALPNAAYMKALGGEDESTELAWSNECTD